MGELLVVMVNGAKQEVAAGTTVAAAMMMAKQACRISVTGTPRGAMCGMGICFECRAVVNGVAHKRTCQMACEAGMRVETSA